MAATETKAVNTSTLLDLYDFFSMFIPGATFIIGLLPFLPSQLALKPYELAFLVIILGYVTGRGIHSAAESADNFFNTPNHRDLFVTSLSTDHSSPELNDLFDSFYRKTKQEIALGNMPDKRTGASEDLGSIIYVHTRSVVEMAGKGRSKTFQATFAFYRSIHFVIVALAVVYIAYSLMKYTGSVPTTLQFSTYIGNLGIPPMYLVGVSELMAGLSLATFHDAKTDHRTYYVHYLVQDYLLIDRDGE